MIRTINVEKGEVVGDMKAHANGVNGVLYNQDNSTLYSIGGDEQQTDRKSVV